jgi:hypothetical protein
MAMPGNLNPAVYDDPEFRALSDVARLVLCYFFTLDIHTPEAMEEAGPDVAATTGLPPMLVGIGIGEIISKGAEKLLAKYSG